MAHNRRTHGVLHSAEENAQKRVDEIDIYDFDQIVFRSSMREGVWEPDTLFRVFGLFHHDETRRLAKESPDLHKLADAVRGLSLVSTDSFEGPTYNTIALQRLDLYENADYLNAHFIPIDIGDIFQKTGDSSKHYILLSQACDLMVRSDGKRGNPFFAEGLLAEIVTMDSPSKIEMHMESCLFSTQTQKPRTSSVLNERTL